MGICFSPTLDEDNQFLIEYERDGQPLNWLIPDTLYFTGNHRLGIAISTRILRPYVGEMAGSTIEIEGSKYVKVDKAEAFNWAAIITYFRKAGKLPGG